MGPVPAGGLASCPGHVPQVSGFEFENVGVGCLD